MSSTRYSAAQARKIVGISQRCLDYWDEREIVCPSRVKASGKGSERKYSFDDLLKLTLVKKLRDSGLSLQRIRKGLEKMRKRWPKKDPLLDELLATDGKKFFRIREDKVMDVVNGQMLMSFVAVGRIREELERKVIRFGSSDELGRGRPKHNKAAGGSDVRSRRATM